MSEFFSSGEWIVVVLTGLFALGGSWYGSRLGRITEHQQWLRNEKKKYYIDAISHIGKQARVFEELRSLKVTTVPADKEPTDIGYIAPLLTMAPAKVRLALGEYARTAARYSDEMDTIGDGDWQDRLGACHKQTFDAADRAITEMRNDLGVKD